MFQPMMWCNNCNRDYRDGLRFCHQCGEPLQPRRPVAEPPPAREERTTAQRRARAVARRAAPTPSSSLLFAILVLLGAGVGLALVWHQWWMPSLVRVSAKLPEGEAPQPIDRFTPKEAPAAPVAPEAPATESPVTAPAPEPAAPPRPAPGASSLPPATAPAPEPASPPRPAPGASSLPPTAPAPAPAPEPVPRKAAPRVAPVAPDADRPAAPLKQPATVMPQASSPRSAPGAAPAQPVPSVRFDPAPAPQSGARVITLVPVGAGAGARAQLYWEFSQGGRLVVSGLPPPPPGRTYQLWLGNIRLGNRASGGVLIVDSQGDGILRVAPLRATWLPDIFGVTVERQGGAREPSDELVLVGELARQTAATPKEPGAPAASPSARPPSTVSGPGQDSVPASSASPEPGPPAASAVGTVPPPSSPAPGPEGPLVRIVPAPAERAWSVTQSVLRSLGWGIERTDRADGLIRTEPRNLDFKNVGVYAAGTRHTLDLVVRAVSETHTSISVKRELFEEQRILWSRERTKLPLRDTAVEQAVLDAIEHLL